MNFAFAVALLCLGGSASSAPSSSSAYGLYPYGGVVNTLEVAHTPVYASSYGGIQHYGPAPLAADGRVVDTPEVAHAKAAHFSAYNSIAHGVYAANYGGVQYYGGAPLAADGRVVDTPEVAHAKAAHLAAYNAIAQGSYAPNYGGVQYYGGAPLAADGRVVDTPEVAHAKAAHFAAYNAVLYGNSAHGVYSNVPHDVYAAGYGSYGPAPLAADGRVVDTPEVAQAKAAHFAAHHEALHRSTAPIYGAGVYGVAPVQLTHDGIYLKDTQAVEHARALHLASYAAIANRQLSYVPVTVDYTPEVAHARAQHLAAFAATNQAINNNQYEYASSNPQYYQW